MQCITISGMALPRATKYGLANAGLVLVGYCVYHYYVAAMGQPRDGSESQKFLLLGALLYVAIAIVATVRAYQYRSRRDTVGQSRKASAIEALGMVGAVRLKSVTIELVITEDEFDTLESKGILELPPERFNLPLHNKDIVKVTTNKNMYNRSAVTNVTRIDGVNRRVTITLTK